MTKNKTMGVLAALGLAASVAGGAQAQLVNGSFESNGGNGQLSVNTSVTGWTTPAPPGNYTFLFAPGTADTSGASGEFGTVTLWGPGNGVANGLPTTSPDGGYFIAADSAFQQGDLSQSLTGLTPGQTYTVGFWWAAAQQVGFGGPTESQWQVSLGSQTQSTAFASIPDQGFSGWMHQTFNFTPTSSDEVLSFLANGSPQVPPFALLDGVTLTTASSTVPEPTILSALFAGALGYGVFRRRRARAAKQGS